MTPKEILIDFEREEEVRRHFLEEANEIHEQLDNISVDLLDLEDIIDSSAIKECSAYVRLAMVAIEKEL